MDHRKQMMCRMKISLSLLLVFCLILTVSGAVVAQITGRSVVSPNSLLSGCTVSATNTLSSACQTAATNQGYTLVFAEGFESGAATQNGEFAFGYKETINGVHPHTGTKAEACTIDFDGEACVLEVRQGTIGSSNHIYISYWRYFDPNGCSDTEIYFSEISTSSSPGTFNFNVVFDTQNSLGAGSTPFCAPPNPYAQLIRQAPSPGFDFPSAAAYAPPLGRWEQVEIEFQGSTCTGSVSNNDGLYNLYVNGQRLIFQANININTCSTGFSSAGMGFNAGGFYTFCASHPSCAPKNGPFNVYIDDVIFLKK